MLIRVGFEVAFAAPQPAAMLLLLHLHHTRAPTIRKTEQLRVEPPMAVVDYHDIYGNHCGRVFAPSGRLVFRNDAIVEDCGLPDLQVPNAMQHNVQHLPDDTLLLRFASDHNRESRTSLGRLLTRSLSFVTSGEKNAPRRLITR